MAGKKPRHGWLYMINPKQVVLRCDLGHEHSYDISGPDDLDCSHSSCTSKINSSSVMRGKHPYIVWSVYTYGKFHLCHAIPLTSRETFQGLPTSYPIKAHPNNGLTCNSLALVHQLTAIDVECFKDVNGNWSERLGVINTGEKKDLEERLRYALNLPNCLSEDWFTKNSSPELLEKVYMGIEPIQREEALSRLVDKL